MSPLGAGASKAPKALDLRIERPAPDPCAELIALHLPTAESFGERWPLTPGAVRRAPTGAPELLHFAPARWLIPKLDNALRLELGALVDAGAAELVDVEGKWRRMSLAGMGATRTLRAGTGSVLADRECAALTLFDCPVILASRNDGFDLWIRSSYYASFDAAIENVNR